MLSKSFYFYKLPIISGLLISLSYIPFYPWASIFSFIPLWIFVLQQKKVKPVFYASLITGIVLASVSSYWIFIAITDFGKIPIPLSFPLSLLFSTISQLFIPLASILSLLVICYLKLSKAYGLIILAILFSLLQQFVPTPLPWYASTTFLQHKIPLYHFADIVGFAGLNSFLLFINASLAYAYLYKKKIWATATIISFFLLVGLGYLYGKSYQIKSINKKILSVQVVQSGIGSIPDYQKHFPNSSKSNIQLKMLNLYMKETLKTIRPNTISLWPESALLNYANEENLLTKNLKQFSLRNNISIMFGSWFFNKKHQLPQVSLFFHSPLKKVQIAPYHKVKLVAFGETLPFKQYFPNFINWLYTKLPPIGNFLAVKKPVVRQFQKINFGPQICYESLFPELTRNLSKQGAQILLNVTNDSWYDSWFQPNQHLYTSFSRAVEARLPMLRATTTGISGAILANGKVLPLSPYKKGISWSKVYHIPYSLKNKPTFYTQYPNTVNYLLLISLFGLLILKYTKSK